jgi:hypothetical protein
MANRIRIIPHKGVPKCGSFEVRFPDGRPSRYFYWDDRRPMQMYIRGDDREGHQALEQNHISAPSHA